MSGATGLGDSEAMHAIEALQDGFVTSEKCSEVSPGGHYAIGSRLFDGDPMIVVRPNRIVDLVQPGRIGGSVRKQVDKNQSSEAPGLGKTNAATNRRVVDVVVSGRRIQADEQGFWE